MRTADPSAPPPRRLYQLRSRKLETSYFLIVSLCLLGASGLGENDALYGDERIRWPAI